MPYVKTLRSAALPFIYNVHAAVGPAAANFRADVLLVQYLLRGVFANAGALGHTPPPGGRPVAVDGVCGPVTGGAILHFQRELAAKGQPIAADGLVDRAYPGSRTPSGLQWTIVFVNLAFRRVLPGRHADLAGADDCPAELRDALL